MKKIKSVFQRDYEGNWQIVDKVVLGCEWVLDGEGKPTRKWDGTCCMIKGGKLFKRYDVKKDRNVPSDFIPAQDKDVTIGHWPGWRPVDDGPDDKYFREAFNGQPDGTYELCGPKVQSNPEHFEYHVLIPHGVEILEDCERTFDGIRTFLENKDIEGIVWHHTDGRMAKVKLKDYGLGRKV
jgi:hypothetical protein